MNLVLSAFNTRNGSCMQIMCLYARVCVFGMGVINLVSRKLVHYPSLKDPYDFPEDALYLDVSLLKPIYLLATSVQLMRPGIGQTCPSQWVILHNI